MSNLSPIRYSPSTGGFYHTDIHGDAMPADAQRVTLARHAALLAGQASGRKIYAGTDGKPMLAPLRAPTAAQLLERAVNAIKAEASRRILAVASLERQANDNAAIASFALALALALATGTEAGGSAQEEEASAACSRRARIDAIRAASNALEAKIASWAAAALSKFDAGADALWPAGE